MDYLTLPKMLKGDKFVLGMKAGEVTNKTFDNSITNMSSNMPSGM